MSGSSLASVFQRVKRPTPGLSGAQPAAHTYSIRPLIGQNVLHSTLCLRRRAKISRCDDIHPLRKESISGWATSRKQTLVNRVDRFAGKARDLHLCELRGTERDCENRALAKSGSFSHAGKSGDKIYIAKA